MVLIFTKGRVDPRAVVRSEGNMSLKNAVAQPGIDPGTVRLEAQGLNHYATPGITQVILLYCNTHSDSEGRVYIFGGDVMGHCEGKNVHMNMFLIPNGYRDGMV